MLLHPLWGWLGTAVGIPVGFIGGLCASSGLVALSDNVAIRSERNRRRRDLRDCFGSYWSKDQTPAWERELQSLRVGDEVSGKVVRKYYYGVFVDVGRGFPAMLAKLYSNQDTLDADPDVGTEIIARVREFDSNEHIVKLSQKEDEPSNNDVQATS